ncbi:UNVERIFIED_CONTAM: hypothetical protein Sradi_4096100 [Sesamum radiatum]|uniref:Uncharacterized protein n=1 Tax=Sesamum radiatum TaxID=300843 RepID=A0AAW2P0V5_SESRA
MNKVTIELTFALSVEECYWKQNVVCKWLTEREKNTKYFRTLVKKKRKQSRIHSIQHKGITLTKSEEIKDSIVDYFTQVVGFLTSYQRRIFNIFAASPRWKRLKQ